MPTLVLVRHAKSAYPDGVSDHDRPLNERGERESLVMAQRIGERFDHLDLALVSTARRAQQTWTSMSEVWPDVPWQDRPELYVASAVNLLSQVRSLPVTAETVAMVGHNEGLEDLASELSGVPVTMKTSTYAVLTSDQPWSLWSTASAALAEVVVAR
ncbi:MAG: histidine phosphatase family protein [Actinomycetes bacterium]